MAEDAAPREQPESRRVVISSVTGKPMEYPQASTEGTPAAGGTDPDDERLLRDIPPHWGQR